MISLIKRKSVNPLTKEEIYYPRWTRGGGKAPSGTPLNADVRCVDVGVYHSFDNYFYDNLA